MRAARALLALGVALPGPVRSSRGTAVVRPVANTSSFGGGLQGFTFPYLDGPRVLFGSDVASDKGSWQSALLVFHGQEAAQVVNSSTPILGTQPGRFVAFGDFSISQSGEGSVGFAATVDVAGATLDGVYVTSPSIPRGGAVPVVTTQGAEGYLSFREPTVAVLRGGQKLLVTCVASKGHSHAAVLLSEVDLATRVAGKPRTLIETGDVIPGSGGLPFLCLFTPSVNSDGVVVFFGSHCSTTGSPAIAAQAARHAVERLRRRSSHCLHLGADRVWPGIFAARVGMPLQVVASASTPIPSGVKGELFKAFSSPALGADGTVAFVGEGSTSLGVYAAAPGGGLRLVASTRTLAAAGGRFQDFPEPPSVGCGRVAFYAVVSGGLSGVYLEGAGAMPAAMPKPVPLLTLQDRALGAGIVYVGFGRQAYNETTNEVAAYLVLDDEAETDGVYVVSGGRAMGHLGLACPSQAVTGLLV